GVTQVAAPQAAAQPRDACPESRVGVTGTGDGSAKPTGGAAPARRDTTMRIAEAVEEHTGRLRNMVIGLAALLVVGVGGAWWIAHRDSARAQAQIDALLKRNDSLSAAFEQSVSSMRGKVAGLDSALMMSKADGDQLRARIRTEMAKGDQASVGELTAQLNAAEGRQRALVGAAQVDYPGINAKNAAAIVFLAVQQANGDVESGSGFNVSPSGLVITNKHVVQDAKGQPAKQLLVAFEGTTAGWKKAHVVKVSPTDELAWVKIDEGGGYPVVAGVVKDASIRVGAPVAMIGYPLGTGTAGNGGDITKLHPTSTMTVGTVSKTLPDILQIDGYAAQGSSGSAIFDARGFVVGVLYGGPTEAAGRIVYAVPSAKLVAQMPTEGAGIVR
ncbi:MAG: trypsin-like peptidase domain-containing protein, partial [Gemmatimonadales bacterium]